VTFISGFWELCIETVSSCNRTCPTCMRNSYPNRETVAGRFGQQNRMPDEMFRKIIDDAVDMGFVGSVNLQHFNEPFQDPRIADFAAYAKGKNQFSSVYMHSNGDLITRRKAASVDGILDKITIALYDEAGGQPMDPIKAANRRHELQSWFTKTQLVWTPAIHLVTHFSPYANLQAAIVENREKPCTREVQLRMILDWRGEMLLCCEDIAGIWKLGNVADQSVSDLWNSEKHQSILATLSEPGGRNAYPFCRSCPRTGTWD
jgi:radical SAM protein with 4Fe4S-binding SPASM domain